MVTKEREIPEEIKDLVEEYRRRIPIDHKEIINGRLKTTLFFDGEKPFLNPDYPGKDEYWRHLTGILVVNGNQEIDLCSFAPENTRFETDSAISTISRYEPEVPLAKTVSAKGTIIVILNPDIYNLRGGNLLTLHEIGHAWQMHDGRLDSAEARKLIFGFSGKKKSEAVKEELLEALDLLNQSENDAWRFALNKYQEIKNGGFDLASQLTKAELRKYPQTVYDQLYNREIWKALEVVGQKHKLRWRTK